MKRVIIYMREIAKRTEWRKWRYKNEIQAVAVIGGKKNPKIMGSTIDARHAFESDKTRVPFEKGLETRSKITLAGYLAHLAAGWGENAEELKRFGADVLEVVEK